MTWSPERTREFRQMWRMGATDRELARAFDVSLKAAIGKRQRLDLACNREIRPTWTAELVAMIESRRQQRRSA